MRSYLVIVGNLPNGFPGGFGISTHQDETKFKAKDDDRARQNAKKIAKGKHKQGKVLKIFRLTKIRKR